MEDNNKNYSYQEKQNFNEYEKINSETEESSRHSILL